MSDRVLVIGGGAREHCLAWKIAQSEHVATVFVAPGNAGVVAEPKVQCVTVVDVVDQTGTLTWCKDNSIDLVVIGPEAPLAAGLSDSLMEGGIPCFGPSAAAAQIEASKEFSKAFMDRQGIPTARWASFSDADSAIEHIKGVDYEVVVKASGLAAGKGVVVAASKEQAIDAVQGMLEMHNFGEAGSTVVIEEKLTGEEISVFAFSDGENIAVFPPAQDFKRAFDNDEGLNTGGMGAYCPVPHISSDILDMVRVDVIQKTIDGMKSEGCRFVGLLYAGLMLTEDGPRVLEFNCRFGDPETQVVVPLIESDLYATLMECVNGDLPSAIPTFKTNKFSVAVVLASGGYPAAYKKGMQICGLEKAMIPNVKVFHAGTATLGEDVVTSGGRVLSVTGIGGTLSEAREAAYLAAPLITFDGCFYRKDIAMRAAKRSECLTYCSSGVDIDAGTSLVEAIKPLARNTARSGVMSELGGFGALFDLKAAGYQDPIIVSGTDGVGTKLKIAQSCDDHTTVGIDLVAMCVNDILAQGAEPLFFLDYFACGKLNTTTAKYVLGGIAKACAESGCALLGGETAEMPGMYLSGEYDVAGFACGAVDRSRLLPRVNAIKPGDAVIGLASSGVHSNGFSLVRRIVEVSGYTYAGPCPFLDDGRTLGQELLTPTRIYVRALLPLIKEGLIKAFAHITGGGLLENIPRVLPPSVCCVLDAHAWRTPAVFGWLAAVGNVEPQEMLRTFNCGLGGVIIVDSEVAELVLARLVASGEVASSIGIVGHGTANRPQVQVRGFETSLELSIQGIDITNSVKRVKREQRPPRMRVAVLISGTGTNLQAIIDQSVKEDSSISIALVISNKADVKGITRAEEAGIPCKVVDHKLFGSRLEFDLHVHSILEEANIELVCLAGFMRILTGEFVSKWRGRLINVHPSLLPSFKGMDAHRQVLEAGVRLTGCTVHFVEEQVDAGGIILQESVPVMPGDSEESLQERVKTVEHIAYPKAVELLASRRVVMNQETGKVEFT